MFKKIFNFLSKIFRRAPDPIDKIGRKMVREGRVKLGLGEPSKTEIKKSKQLLTVTEEALQKNEKDTLLSVLDEVESYFINQINYRLNSKHEEDTSILDKVNPNVILAYMERFTEEQLKLMLVTCMYRLDRLEPHVNTKGLTYPKRADKTERICEHSAQEHGLFLKKKEED